MASSPPDKKPAMLKDDPKTVRGWCLYDWANSAYITTAVGLLPIYFASVVVPKDGAILFGETFRVGIVVPHDV